MLKLEYTGLNTGKFHDELLTAGIAPTTVLSKDGTTILLFQDIREVKTDVFDENEQVIDTVVSYQKRTYETIMETDEEENEITKQIEVWNEFDFVLIQVQIDSVIANHDPTPLPAPPTQDDFLLDFEFRISMLELGL